MKKILFLVTTTMLLSVSYAAQTSIQSIEVNGNIENIKEINEKRLEAYNNAKNQNGRYFISANNPPECADYSTEGICSLLNTRINGFPKNGHINTILNYKFPNTIGDYTAKCIYVYSPRELGYSIKYINNKSEITLDIYVYDPTGTDIVDETYLKRHTESLAEGIIAVHQNVTFDKNYIIENFENDSGLKYYGFYASFYSNHFNLENKMKECQTFTMLFTNNKKLIKFRITQNDAKKEAFKKLVNEFIKTFDKEVILDSKTRKEKFEPTIIYPIID